MNIPQISVRVITYNQEKLISRALNSILQQKEYVYEIVVSDDCSTDKTWEVIQKYCDKYPDIIKPCRNKKNLGIYGNVESTFKKITGQLLFDCSGDDELVNGLFKNAIERLQKETIDYENDAYCVYGDFKEIRPNGKEKFYSNQLIEKYDPIKLKIRNLIFNRSVGYSKKVFEKIKPFYRSFGDHADGLHDIQYQLYAEKNYYFKFVGSIYYSGIGVSVTTEKKKSLNSKILMWNEYKIILPSLSKKDNIWLSCQVKKYECLLNKRFRDWLNYFVFLLIVIFFDDSYKSKFDQATFFL